MSVTSIEKIKETSGGKEVELPSFDDETPFIVKLRRPSLLMLCKSGKIPNQLLASAAELFEGRAKNTLQKENGLDEMLSIMEVICEASFVEPTYNQLQENGIELTDEQMMAVFNYSQQGVRALEQFRTKRPNN